MSGPLPVHPQETFTHVLEQNQTDAPEAQVTFRCRTLTGLERNEISDELFAVAVTGASSVERAGAVKRAARRCLLSALEGWENWKDDQGKPVAFPDARASLLSMLHPNDVTEIGSEIAVRSGLWGSPQTEEVLSD